MADREKDLLIAGGGLAGTMLAWETLWAGKSFLLVDPREEGSASRVAAGIINPVAGRNLAPLRGGRAALDEAIAFYQRIEAEFHRTFFFPLPIERFLLEERMSRRFERKLEAGDYQGLARYPDTELDEHCFQPLPDRLELPDAGRVDVKHFLDFSWHHFGQLDSTCVGRVDPDADEIGLAMGKVHWNGFNSDQVVFTRGFEETRSSFFDCKGFRPAKGEILDLKIPGLGGKRIMVGRKWLLPVGGDRFRAGATYDLENLDSIPTEKARSEIETHLRQFLRLPFEVYGQEAAVRPVYRKGLPFCRVHEKFKQVYLFNGLGSKGCLHGPAAAAALVAHLFHGADLPPDPNQ